MRDRAQAFAWTSFRCREKCSALVKASGSGASMRRRAGGETFGFEVQWERVRARARHTCRALAGCSLLPDSFPQKSSETEPSSASLWLWQFMLHNLPPSFFFLARLTAARRETDTEAILTASQRSSIAELWSCLKRGPAARTWAVFVHCGVKPVSTNLTAV